MSIKIKYAYLKDQTWMFRRNYPRDVSLVIGSAALKQSLKTGDPKLAANRAAEVNRHFDVRVREVRSGLIDALGMQSGPLSGDVGEGWDRSSRHVLARLRATLGPEEAGVSFHRKVRATPIPTVGELSERYLRKRGDELRPGGFKSVRYSVGLFTSRFGDRQITSISRDDGRWFVEVLPNLSASIGKSWRTRGLPMDRLLDYSTTRRDKITVRTQKRIWTQINHFLDWSVYEGHRDDNPFRTVLLDRKVKASPYAVPSDEDVLALLAARDEEIFDVLLLCLLSGMRAGEAAGLLREDLVRKGNLGTFAHVRPNAVRELKTDASEREVPLHSAVVDRLDRLPGRGPLFPDLTVDRVTKRFAFLRARLGLKRPGLVFHSTRKWFITQCERTGVPEHFTASLVGHKSARSENKLTYGIYSAGISDEQKRSIVDQVRLPAGCVV